MPQPCRVDCPSIGDLLLARFQPDDPCARCGQRAPGDLPRGEFSTQLIDGRVHIVHADPRILISAELLDMIADNPSPAAWLDTTGCQTFIGALLKIDGANRQVVYRITEWLPRVRGFIGEWPD